MRLKDKTAIITGAASGIGKEIAVVFAREGAKFAIADLDQKAADATAKEIDSSGKRAIGVAMDVANEEQVEAGTTKVIKAFGTLDVLVSNAGIQIVAPVVDFEFAKWKRLLSIHLDGAFLTTRAALRQMYKQNSGSIIYMGSVHSKEASKLKAPYVTAKHGLVGLTKVIAIEVANKGVTCNAICPGWVLTALVQKQIEVRAAAQGIPYQQAHDDLLRELAGRARDHAGRDRPVVARETRALEVVEQPLQLSVLAECGLVEDRLLAELVELLSQLLVVGLGVEDPTEPARSVIERTGDAVGGDLERLQHARTGRLDAVQEAVVGLAEVDRDEREREHAERPDDEASAKDRIAAGRVRGRGALGGGPDRRHARR